MTTGLDIVKQFESCRLKAYLCPVGIPTIGWGHTKDVNLGDTCTQEQADVWLQEDWAESIKDVQRYIKVPLQQNQLQALASFVYNLGANAFAKSTLLKKVNVQDWEGAEKEFGRWVYGTVKGVKGILPGLVRRRLAESKLFAGKS